MSRQTMPSAKQPLYFATKSYPRFGRGKYSEDNPPKTVKSSPFYWWFKFLQLNEEYRRTSKNKGIGVCAELYKDFGDVDGIDFKTWWRGHEHLFADEPTTYRLKAATSPADLAPFDSNEAINVVVPLNWNQKSLKKRFAMLLDKYDVKKGERGHVTNNPNARYSLGRRWNCAAMEAAYKVYVIRQQNLDKGAKVTPKAQYKGATSNKFKLAWADVAIQAKLKITEGMKEGKVTADSTERRRLLTILATRYYKKAEAFILSAATPYFPKAT
jgi:hypothetical protein